MGKAYDIILTEKKANTSPLDPHLLSEKKGVGGSAGRGALAGQQAASGMRCAGHRARHFLQDFLIKLPKQYGGKHHQTHFIDEETEAERSSKLKSCQGHSASKW